MKAIGLWVSTLLAAAAALTAAEPAEEVSAAIKKLSEAGSYAWTTTAGSAGSSTNQSRRTVTEGALSKEGVVHLSIARYGQNMEALVKGNKGAYKTLSEWQGWNAEPEAGGATNRFRTGGRSMFSSKTPAKEASELLSKATKLKKDGADITGEFPPEESFALALLGVRMRAAVLDESQTRGTIRFKISEGRLLGYEFRATATFKVGGSERRMDRTVQVDIREVGKASFEVPVEAKKFL